VRHKFLVFLVRRWCIGGHSENDPDEYRWSSYQINGLGKFSDLCKPRQEYLSLGKDLLECQGCYRELFIHQVEGELLKEIGDNSNKGMAIRSDRFKKEIETLTGSRLKLKKRGRPVGWRGKGEIESSRPAPLTKAKHPWRVFY